MTNEQQHKLQDFIFSLRQKSAPSVFPIGAIILNEVDRVEIEQELERERMRILSLNSQNEYDVSANMIDTWLQGKGVVVAIHEPLSQQLRQMVIELFEANRVNIRIAGELEPRVMNPMPQGAFLILMMNEEVYRTMEARHVITEFCNLGKIQ